MGDIADVRVLRCSTEKEIQLALLPKDMQVMLKWAGTLRVGCLEVQDCQLTDVMFELRQGDHDGTRREWLDSDVQGDVRVNGTFTNATMLGVMLDFAEQAGNSLCFTPTAKLVIVGAEAMPRYHDAYRIVRADVAMHRWPQWVPDDG